MAGTRFAPVLGHIYQLAGRPGDIDLSDGQLLRRFVQRQDQAAFEALVRRHGPLVWRVCRRTVARADLAEDAFQATFVVLARRAASVRKPASLASWLHGVAYRIARRAQADADRSPSEPLTGVPSAGPDPARAAAWRELGEIIEEEVQRLPERLRAPLLLCYWEGETNVEAARRLGWPCGTVKTRLARARRLLHARLIRRGVLLPSGAVALLLAPDPGHAAVPALLRAMSARALTAAGASARVAALAEGVLPGAAAPKLALGLLLVLATAAGVGGVALTASPTKPPNPPAAQAAGTPARESAATQAGDGPLPEGAVARLGSGRFRHGENVWSVAFSLDGKVLASGGGDQTVRLWDVNTGKQLRVFTGFQTFVASLAFSPDGNTLVAAPFGAESKGIRLLDVTTGAERAFEGSSGVVGGPALFSPDGKTLAGVDASGQILLWDAASGQRRGTLRGHTHPNLKRLAFSPDGKVLASSSQDATICLWDVARQRPLHVLRSRDNCVYPVAFSADGKWLISGGATQDERNGLPGPYHGGAVRIWDVATGKLLRTLEDPTFWEGAQSLAVAPDGRALAVGGNGGVTLWDLGRGQRLRALGAGRECYQRTQSLCFSPDGKLLAGGFGSAVYLWETASGRLLTPRPEEAAAGIRSVALARDGRLLAALDTDGTVGLWDLARRRAVRRLSDPGRRGYARIGLSPDGKTLATALRDGSVHLWDVADGRRRCSLPGGEPEDSEPSYLAFSPDGTLLASAHFSTRQKGGPRTIRVWDPAAGKLLQTLRISRAQLAWFVAVAFSADNRRLTATAEGETYRWHSTGGKFAPDGVIGRTPTSASLVYSPDGLLAVADSFQDGVALWDLKAGRPKLTMPGPNGFGRVLGFSPDGRYLASGPPLLVGGTGKEIRDHSLRVYEVASGQEVLRREPPAGAFVGSLTFASDNRTLVTGMTDSTVLVWDLFPAAGPDDLPVLWQDLANVDGRRAHRALAALVRAGDRAVAFLGEHLEPARRPDPGRLAALIADLDNDRFESRQKASRELAALAETARPALERALAAAPSAEARRRIEQLLEAINNTVPTAEGLRRIRAVTVLEHVGSPSARKLLGQLRDGAPESRLTQEAKAALQRLAERPGR